MRTTLIGLACCGVVACGSAGPPDSDPTPSAVVTIRGPLPVPPARVGDYKMVEESFIDLNDGTQYRYARGDEDPFDVDIFPFPFSDLGCRDACLDRLVDREAEGFKHSLPVYIEHGFFDEARVDSDEGMRIRSNGEVRARHVKLVCVRDGIECISHFVLLPLHGYQVKVRFTYRPEDERENELSGFVEELVESIDAPYRCNFGPADTEALMIESTVARDTASVSDAVLRDSGGARIRSLLRGPRLVGHSPALRRTPVGRR